MKAMIGDEPMHETSPVSAFLRHIQLLLYDESFAASAYCVQYISIACEAANGHSNSAGAQREEESVHRIY